MWCMISLEMPASICPASAPWMVPALPNWCFSHRRTGSGRHQARCSYAAVVGGVVHDGIVGDAQAVKGFK